MNGQAPCRVCTFNVPTNYNGVIRITAPDNVTKVTIQVVTGPVLMTGNFQFANTAAGRGNEIPSKQISLAAGTAFTFESGGPEAPIDNLSFDATGGACNFVMCM